MGHACPGPSDAIAMSRPPKACWHSARRLGGTAKSSVASAKARGAQKAASRLTSHTRRRKHGAHCRRGFSQFCAAAPTSPAARRRVQRDGTFHGVRTRPSQTQSRASAGAGACRVPQAEQYKGQKLAQRPRAARGPRPDTQRTYVEPFRPNTAAAARRGAWRVAAGRWFARSR